MDNKNVAVSEENELTITNLKMEDTSVIQCNATNKHGYIFANAYLKVGGKSQLHLFSFCDSKNLPKLATPSTHVQLFFIFQTSQHQMGILQGTISYTWLATLRLFFCWLHYNISN